MKKNYLFLLASLIVLGSMFLLSCEETELDNEKPVIRLIAPADGEAYKPGSDIHFDVEFTDNMGLGSYKVIIHGAFDGHTHSAKILTRAEGEGTDNETFEKTWLERDFIALGDEPIAGKRNASVHHHHIVIPENVREGNYHFLVYCTDESGLESFVAREIIISSDAEEHLHH